MPSFGTSGTGGAGGAGGAGGTSRPWIVLVAVAAIGALSLSFGLVRRVSPSNAPPRPPGGRQRALWVWNAREALTRPGLDALLALCDQWGFDTLFLSSSAMGPRPTVDDVEVYRVALRRLHRAGRRVEVLLGQANWVDRAPSALPPRLETVLQYQEGSRRAERFDGVHLDVEPQTLPAWRNDRPALLRRYLGMLSSIAGAIRRRDPSTLVTADIAPYYFSIATDHGRSLGEAVLDEVDVVALMAYSPADGRILDQARTVAGAARARGRTSWVGLKASAGFWPRGLGGLLETMALLEAQMPRDGVRGVALHSYGTLSDLLER